MAHIYSSKNYVHLDRLRQNSFSKSVHRQWPGCALKVVGSQGNKFRRSNHTNSGPNTHHRFAYWSFNPGLTNSTHAWKVAIGNISNTDEDWRGLEPEG